VPIYAFTCEGCGPFELLRPIAEAGSAARCPACGTEARRVFTPPGLARLARPARTLLDWEDMSAPAPALVTEKRGRPLPHQHGPAPPWVLKH
jgi:putative FmdB family regulatory protein